jgi:hypothetical protein
MPSPHATSRIPKAVYERVLQLAIDIVNGTHDRRSTEAINAYRRMRRYCLANLRPELCRAFLLETLADFTTSRSLSISYYRRALRFARTDGDQCHTILVALGERYLEGHQRRSAVRCFTEALGDARRCRDTENIRAASVLLKETRDGSTGAA